MWTGGVAAGINREAGASGVPPAVGVNFTAIVQSEFGNAVALQVPPLTVKSLAFVPLKLSLSGSENGDKFVTVTFRVFVVAVRVPLASEIGVTVAGIVAPVVSATV